MQKSQKGVTIVEVLVALSIVSLVFVVLVKVFNQFASREGLKTSTHDLVADINDILSDVKEGVYYDKSDVECTFTPATGGGGTFSYATSIGARAGQNNKCIFLGKAVILGTSPSTVGTAGDDSSDYYIYTLMGPGQSTGANNSKFSSIDALDIFKNDTAPKFDSTVNRNLSARTVITESYIWDDINGDSVVDRSSEIAYIDGFAIVNSSWGVNYDTFGNVRGGARSLKILSIYPCKDYELNSRSRPTSSGADSFRSRTQNNAQGDCSAASNKSYYHSEHDPSSGKNVFADGEIIVCLLGSAGKAYVKIGSQSG